MNWKTIPGIPERYEVSDLGEMRFEINGVVKLMKGQAFSGYSRISLTVGPGLKRKTFPLHRLVALAFLPNPENKKLVNHINGQRSDNRLENLEWVDHKENSKNAMNRGSNVRGENHPMAKLTDAQVEEIKELFRNGAPKLKVLAEQYGVTKTAISYIRRGTRDCRQVTKYGMAYLPEGGRKKTPHLSFNPPETIIKIKELLALGKTSKEIMEELSVSDGLVYRVKTGKRNPTQTIKHRHKPKVIEYVPGYV